MAIDFALDAVSHDLVLENFDFKMSFGKDEIVQRVKIRLLTFQGEWFLDTLQGISYYDNILIKNPDVRLVDALIRAEIQETAGISEIESYQSTFDTANRKYSIVFSINTEFGQAEITQELI